MKRSLFSLVILAFALGSLAAQNWYKAVFTVNNSPIEYKVTAESTSEAEFILMAKNKLGGITAYTIDQVVLKPGSLVAASDEHQDAYNNPSLSGDFFYRVYAYHLDLHELVEFIYRAAGEGMEGSAGHITSKAIRYACDPLWPDSVADKILIVHYEHLPYVAPGVTFLEGGAVVEPGEVANNDADDADRPAPTYAEGAWYEVLVTNRELGNTVYTMVLEAVDNTSLSDKAKALIRTMMTIGDDRIYVDLANKKRIDNPYASTFSSSQGNNWFDSYAINVVNKKAIQLVYRDASPNPSGAADIDQRCWAFATALWPEAAAGVNVIPYQTRYVASREPVALAVPANFALSPREGAIQASWNAVANAEDYYLSFYRVGGGGEGWRAVTGTSILLACSPGTWAFSLYARSGVSRSESTAERQAAPLAERQAGPLGKPTNLQIQPGPGSFTLSWTAANNAEHYEVSYIEVNERGELNYANQDQLVGQSSPSTQHGLRGDLRYRVSVVAKRMENGSPERNESEFVFVVVPRPFEAPAVPMVKAGPAQLFISWPRLPNVEFYKLVIRRDDLESQGEYVYAYIDVPGDRNSFLFQPAIPGEQHSVMLRAFNGDHVAVASTYAYGTPTAASVTRSFLYNGNKIQSPKAGEGTKPGPQSGNIKLLRWDITVRIIHKDNRREDKVFSVLAANETAAQKAALDAAKKYLGTTASKSMTPIKILKK